VDYLELEMEFTDGWRVQRQILLAREDAFLFVADAVLGSGESDHQIDYVSRWPLPDSVRFETAEETREGLLWGKKRLGLVLPLALPEWRADQPGGSFAVQGQQLCLEQSAVGMNLFAPLFVDLDPRRMRKSLTWRQLTVGEQLEIVPSEVAVGYRVHVGPDQWLFYRSLASAANRTVLGANVTSEFFLGRFERDGEAVSMLEIEHDA
jgi:hypothetical protein